jgi:hypothetical protein
MKNNLLFIMFLIVGGVLFGGTVFAADYFSWNERIDRTGRSAGIYENTPFPVDENTTDYTIVNDENPGGKIYDLGTKYFVDGAMADDLGDGLSLLTAKKTISAAMAIAGNGNKTIIIRGAHDAFDGVYAANNIVSGYGVNDTHRWMLVGYKQERPIIDGGNSSNDIIKSTGQTDAYATIQRVKLQNSKNQGVRLGVGTVKRDNYFNLIDVWVYNCSNDYTSPDDGGVYYLNSDYGYVSHCASEHHYGHGFKFGDGSSNTIFEWSISANAGYWAGMTPTSYYNNHPGGLQIVSDGTVSSPVSLNNTVRYSIIHSALFGGMEIRRSQNYNIHHNEFYDNIHYYEISGSEDHAQGIGDLSNSQILILGDNTYGDFYSNIVRDPGRLESGSKATGLAYTGITSSTETLVFNNLFYGYDKNTVVQKYGCINQVLRFYNNTVVGNNSADLLYFIESGSTRDVQNNIFYNSGTGASVTYATGQIKNNNFYYYPNGSRGYTGALETGGIESSDPIFVLNPSGTYSWGMGNIRSLSLAKDAGADLSGKFTTDFALTNRPQGLAWDIGAYEYATTSASSTSNIDPVNRYAWSENAGWLDFGQGNVNVTDSSLTGYAWGENIGWINLNPALGGVTNDGNGNLSGSAWGENIGWIFFGPLFGNARIDSSGDFHNYAWGENIGWINFNCANNNYCATVNYKVNTTWRPAGATTYTIGGTISGLTGTVVLQNNGKDDLSRSANGSFTFNTATTTGNSYAVTVLTQPVGQSCAVTNGSGSVSSANVTSVSVTCTTNTFTITASTGANGTVTPSGVTTKDYGASQVYTIATSTAGYHVADILVDGSSVGTSSLTYTFTNIAANHTISATFAINHYTITSSVSGGNGTISPTGATIVSYGATPTYAIATSTPGYHVADILIDGVSVGTSTLPYVFSAVHANHTIVASFAINHYTITASAGANGTVTPSGVTTKSYGDSQAYTIATSTAGYHVADILVDGSSVGTSSLTYTFTNITANHTISATFNPNGSTPSTYTVGGTISGLTGTVVLQNNGKDSLSRSANGSFTFATATTTGKAYFVTVLTQPSGQTCSITSGSGSVSAANVTTVSVTCTTNTCATLSNALTYNAYPTCGAATCASGYTLSGSGSSATCVAQSSGGGSTPADTTAPGIPTNFIASSTVNTIYLSWTNPIDSDFAGVKLYRKLNSAPASQTDTLTTLAYLGTAHSFANTNLQSNSLYYYSLYAYDTHQNYSSPRTISIRTATSGGISTTTIPVIPPVVENTNTLPAQGGRASLVGATSAVVNQVTVEEAQKLIAEAAFAPLTSAEVGIYKKIIALATKVLADASKFTFADFIHFGTPTTLILGAGERGGSVASFRSAFGRLPESELDWQDTVKIGNGRWTTQKSSAAEAKAKISFKKIYLRDPNMNQSNDNAAVNVMAYGLRPAQRNLNSEKNAIKSFKYVFKKSPATAEEWDIVRAIAYSGAKR